MLSKNTYGTVVDYAVDVLDVRVDEVVSGGANEQIGHAHGHRAQVSGQPGGRHQQH